MYSISVNLANGRAKTFTSMGMASNEISYTFYSENLNKLNEAVNKVEDIMNENKGLEDVSSSAEDAYVEYTFKVKQDEFCNMD